VCTRHRVEEGSCGPHQLTLSLSLSFAFVADTVEKPCSVSFRYVPSTVCCVVGGWVWMWGVCVCPTVFAADEKDVSELG